MSRRVQHSYFCPLFRLLAPLLLAMLATELPGAGIAHARFARPDLEAIPVERLIKNLTEIAENPEAHSVALVNLARAHAMAYSTKMADVEIWRGAGHDGVWFGHEHKFAPFSPVPTDDAEKQAVAEKHLQQAIEWFEKAIAKDESNLTAQLGLGWCLAQTKDKDKAIEQLRLTVKKGWAEEGANDHGNFGGHYITSEAGSYLIPLLDAQKDAEEIAELKRRAKHLQTLPRPITPIAIPLRNDVSIEDILDRAARVGFDADGTGREAEWSWITPEAAWLVYDPKATGKIDSGLQMFGSVTFWMFWENGYQALGALDDDGDGILRGKELAGLALWRDANGNGQCEPGEVRPLASFEITELRLAHESAPETASWRGDVAAYSPAGVVFADGETRPSYDVILRQATGEAGR